MPHESDLVTGDAVVLELRLARSATRALAMAIDIAVQLVALVVFAVLLVLLGELDNALLGALIIAGQMLVLIGYPAIFETLSRGRTLGKLALGLRVVREDGGPIRMRHALTRALAGAFVDFGPFWIWSVIGFVTSLSSRKAKRVGDYLAGTVVIRERAPEAAAPTIGMPPALASWAAQLDLTNLPDPLALSVRQYLGRYGQLTEAAREHVGRRLADEVAGHIGAPVPPQVPAWAYLAAVLAERRARDHARASGIPVAGGHAPPQPYQPYQQSQPYQSPQPYQPYQHSRPPPAPYLPREQDGGDGPFAPPG
ncbi:RDD family protein [Qaidamihabitans albus]|uniref:RDD family protein n=1 Tax=Qaidamihabitans albus TaxID=2795733 RepID=UPI0018F26B4F|nr:RDD family protein [Qaidamihabitans albus]